MLESATDSRFEYFKKKIQSLMVKKHVVETLFQASSDCKKLEDSKMNC